MNKKLFASALFAAAAFVSTTASAAITYQNSNQSSATPATGYIQMGDAKVAAGGGSVRGNDLVIISGGGTPSDIPASAEIIVRLPKGLNFDGAPSYKVTPATPSLGLTLKDGSAFGDPTLDAPGVALFDANADGGMDRAVIVVGAAAAVGDKLAISINVVADSTATAGVKKASLIVNAGLAVTQNAVEVVAGFAEPVSAASGTKLSTADQGANAGVAVTTATFTVTVPKGTVGGSKITMTPQSKLTFGTGGTTVTYTVATPLAANPFTAASAFAAGPGTSSVSFTVDGAPTTSLKDDVQVVFMANQVDTVAGGTIGTRGLTLSGAVAGTAALVDVKANGSSAALTTLTVDPTNKNPVIVAGSSAPQALPSIVVTENFDGDAGALPGTSTITINAGTGLVFNAASTPTFAGGTWAATATVTASKVTVTILTNDVTTNLTIDGLMATAALTATGNLSLTVGNPGVGNDSATGPNSTLVVASATPVGTVSVKGPLTTAIKKTGPGSTAVTSTITLTEGTYGALTIVNKTQVQDAYFRLTPSNATIKAVTISYNGYPAGASPTIGVVTPCAAEAGVTTGAWLCEVESESTALVPTTSTISVAINYAAKATAAVGSTVAISVDGNSGVSGSATVANVGVATTATKGVVPDLTPGSTTAANLAPITIKENFTGAVTLANEFRLIAPAGVAFQDVANMLAGSTSLASATLTATFAPNDTLVMTTAATATITFTPKAIVASGQSGWLSFNIVDGNIDGARKAGITNESVMIAYANGTLGAVDAGANAAVNVGFEVTNAATGGLFLTL
jgi:hypothetical protein